MNEKTHTQDDEWMKKLTPEQYRILRKKETEPAFSGKLLNNKKVGIYFCAACGNELFISADKFDSGCGWPSFTKPLRKDSVDECPDPSLGMQRVEITCSKCGGHLGHVFDDGPTPTGMRYCINSGGLDFKEEKG